MSNCVCLKLQVVTAMAKSNMINARLGAVPQFNLSAWPVRHWGKQISGADDSGH